jgi:hypothetical protein
LKPKIGLWSKYWLTSKKVLRKITRG